MSCTELVLQFKQSNKL